jgi:hypothetical protein
VEFGEQLDPLTHKELEEFITKASMVSDEAFYD